MKFEGGGRCRAARSPVGPQPQRIGAPMTVEDVPIMQLDLFCDRRAAGRRGRRQRRSALPASTSSLSPATMPQFRLVHVANGRAMIEDDAGLWVVQPGSMLPDSSRVAGIEQRDGKWVLVTSTDRVVALTP